MKKLLMSMCLFMALTFITSFSLAGQELSPAEIMEQHGNAVVLIATIKNNEEVGLGSGFIVKPDGVIVTNYHVIEGAYPALVKLKNGDVYEDISIIDFNEREDVAVIKIKGFDLHAVLLGNSNNVKVGEKIVVIGNPHGLENTISDGLLSQIRDTEFGYKLHQISAPISPGSSGSPVFNNNGEVIGIATLSDTLGQNLNFSVPINYVRGMIDNPIKCSLKEFVGIEKDESVLSSVKSSEVVDNKKFLKNINDAIIALVKSFEMSLTGLEEVGKPHKHSFKADKYFIHSDIYSANQLLRNAYNDLDAENTSDKQLGELKNKLMRSIEEAHKASNELITALENKSRDGFGNYWPNPQWPKARSAIDAMNMSSRKIDNDFIVTFMDRVKKDNPTLESEVSPFIIDGYEMKDKTEDERMAEDKEMGHLGIIQSFSTRMLTVILVKENSPAEKAGLKTYDVILGLVDGQDFKTLMDYRKFQKTTKPGDKYKFRIERKGKILKKTIKMN